MQNLQKLLEFLVKSPLEFVLVGGFAAVLHGCNQTTRDIDICITLQKNQFAELKKILEPIHPKIRNLPEKPSLLSYESLTVNELHLETDLGILDLITNVEAVGDYYTLLKNAEEIEMYGGLCHLMSIEDLIKSKKALGRHRDLAVVEELEAIIKLVE